MSCDSCLGCKTSRVDIVIQKNIDFEKIVFWKDSNKDPIDITGYTAQADIRDSSGNLIISLSTTNGRITLGGATGQITMSITSADTNLLDFETANYDLKMTDPLSVSQILFPGTVTFERPETE